MKKLIICFYFGFIAAGHCQESFEGIVHYESTYTSKDSTISEEDLNEYFGTITKSFYKDGFYKELSNSEHMEFQLWRHDKKAIYYKHESDEDTLRFSSTTLDQIIPFEYKMIKNSDTILGKPVDKIVLKDGYSTRTYYYSGDLPLDPSFYMEYDKAHKNALAEIMQAYFLRLTINFPLFTVDMVATEIEEKELDNNIFELPEHIYLKEEKE